MDIDLHRRRLLIGATGIASSLILPSWPAAAESTPASTVSPQRALESYRRMLCGAPGEEVLWWFIGDLHYQVPGRSLLPVARSLTIGGYTAGESSARAFRYRFREAGVIVDLATGERLQRNPLTQEAAEVPLVDEPPHDIDWAMQDDGSIVKSAHGQASTLHLRWTETSANLLLLETQPSKNGFGLAPGDSGSDWKAPESARTVYVKRADLAGRGFVPAQMIFNVALKMNPPWLATPSSGEHWLIVRGLGQKSRKKDVVNRDALELVRRYFPKFI
jgi:hypothetical protein